MEPRRCEEKEKREEVEEREPKRWDQEGSKSQAEEMQQHESEKVRERRGRESSHGR